ncbi:MAG: hypothetical protein AMXMBFR53_27880 [Gemmatimonadota bacterium]
MNGVAALRRIPAGVPAGKARIALGVVAAALALKVVAALLAATVFAFALEPIAVGAPGAEAEPADASSPAAEPADAAVLDSLRSRVKKLESAVAARAPRRTYVVIDRANNRLWLRRATEVRLEAVVSTGSGTVLKESGGQQRVWTFDTPPGHFKVLSKRPNPVWTKPDWAFLEEGQLPPESIADRREKGSLGEWALDLGDGYMIHGTLYERLLGRGITHGCIRVGREDLRAVARAAEPGTPVYIF